MLNGLNIKLNLTLLLLFMVVSVSGNTYWQNKKRELRYTPNGESFIIKNGDKRFTRAIYGTNTGFRLETSDYPEFGLYMPNFGGSAYIAFENEDTAKWVKDLDYVESSFQSGFRSWTLSDYDMFGSGNVTISVVALSDGDGFVVNIQADKLKKPVRLITIFGGANDKRFSRSGDIGADPANSFYIEPSKCSGNVFNIKSSEFVLDYAKGVKQIRGVFAESSGIKIADGNKINSLRDLLSSKPSDHPVATINQELSKQPLYFFIGNPKACPQLGYSDLPLAYEKGDNYRKEISGRVKINTPDAYLNTLGGILAGAEDAIWETPSYLHGAIGWRTPLTGWRGAYVADVFGLHDRARKHFESYAESQVTNVPVSLPHRQDSSVNMARSEKTWGTPMYSNGYISRSPGKANAMHHYDMNLVYMDELLWHIKWTGDLEFAKKMFPVIKRHLLWEKLVFDPDNDGLYDGYCCIWASDGLQYNGGVATHSTAYNYRANKIAAEIAEKIGMDATPYKQEAVKILKAIVDNLWLANKGWWAEFKDNMGKKKVHDDAAVWTVYHAIDSEIHDPFMAYEATRYIDNNIPHIPVIAEGLNETDNFVVSTTDWQPYMWSINNVAFAEITHTALAYWQAGRSAQAFKMFKGALLDAMYLGSGPGNITQVSFYDAARGETYRDFADPVATAARAVVYGMFGIYPDLINEKLTIKPGFPNDWNHASLLTANMNYSFSRKGNKDVYDIIPKLNKQVPLSLHLKARKDLIKSVVVNGESFSYSLIEDAIGYPVVKINAGIADKYNVVINWSGKNINDTTYSIDVAKNEDVNIKLPIKSKYLFDPQKVFEAPTFINEFFSGKVVGEKGNRTIYAMVTQGAMTWWQPIDINVHNEIEVFNESESNSLDFILCNYSQKSIVGKVFFNNNTNGYNVNFRPGQITSFSVGENDVRFGTNKIEIKTADTTFVLNAINWNQINPINMVYEKVDIDKYFNDKVTNIFAYGKYVSPRWPFTTLQVPTQGMGQWCHPDLLSKIDDGGFRKMAGEKNTIMIPQGIPFATPGDIEKNNIAFTTLWDNYPDSIEIPLSGKATRAYFLVAASTYHMQSHFLNGTIKALYKDGTSDVLELVLPDNLLPLDQDIFIDDFAFRSPQPRPYRIRFKDGSIDKFHAGKLGVKMSNDPMYVDGGMATVLDLPLNPEKELDKLVLTTEANEVIIGLMSVTLSRN